ncbi:hypothetical protein PN462_22630 [Spirulina sp. CS-785/01]|uniref:hypothetical protein n=1 Tax=Spirulina sp. CS-785/01 TaxID=3021716 RepID=UPI002330EA35|nr:hypothetical protein [Spirulina sp. CS-785/01]MDB9315926.1 hypothetical protein [Spirulina sp. CS-785/01]
MKTALVHSLGVLAMTATVAGWSTVAQALDFSFSFSNGTGNVSGTIFGVPTTGGVASSVNVVNSSIGGGGPFPGGGTFNVSGGNITSANYSGSNGGTLQFSGTQGTFNFGGQTVSGTANFTPVGGGAAAAPWDFNPTLGVLLGLLPLGYGYLKKQGKTRKRETTLNDSVEV